jgi:hypothetical protein
MTTLTFYALIAARYALVELTLETLCFVIISIVFYVHLQAFFCVVEFCQSKFERLERIGEYLTRFLKRTSQDALC